MSNPYSAVVSVIGANDLHALITEFDAFVAARKDGIYELRAKSPWTFEDKSVVRFRFSGNGTFGQGTLLAFSAQHPTYFIDLRWFADGGEAGHGEKLIHKGEVVANYYGGFRRETSMQHFVEPEPEFFVDHVGLTLPQLFKYRLQRIARQIKNASKILHDLECSPSSTQEHFEGVPRDKENVARAQKALDALAAQVAFVVGTLNLEGVLFPTPAECPELLAKIDAIRGPQAEIPIQVYDPQSGTPF